MAGTLYLNASNSQDNLNRAIDLANTTWDESTSSYKYTPNLIHPDVFYSKQLLDTIRLDADQYVYYRLADEMPIQDKADKLTVRRWAPLQAHTQPLAEGVPPLSDKGSVEKYEIGANQYGRYMEFTDKVDFTVVDPVIAHYTREYSLVAMETLDLLAKESLFAVAQAFYAGQVAKFADLTTQSQPTMTDLRIIVLSLKKALVKPRSNGRYHVIGSPEFFFDMINDDTVEQYMTINQTTKTMYDNSQLVPMFEMEFYETMCVPTHGEFNDPDADTPGTLSLRIYRKVDGEYVFGKIPSTNTSYYKTTSGYVNDPRTGMPASYIPNRKYWDLDAYNTAQSATANPWQEFKVQHVLVVGKDALVRTGLAGEGNAKMYVKQKGTTGVLDPIDQRQSIGFKINSVGFGSTRTEAIVDYMCVPTQVNVL